MLALVALSVLYVSVGLEVATMNWYKGLGGKSLEKEWNKCNIYVPGSPWIALLPNRALNFFSKLYLAGPSSCSSVYKFSELKNHLLEINCPEDALVVERPDFVSMRNDTFVLEETGMEAWTYKTKQLQKSYKVPGK